MTHITYHLFTSNECADTPIVTFYNNCDVNNFWYKSLGKYVIILNINVSALPHFFTRLPEPYLHFDISLLIK